jgi:hypothetical protein
VRAMASFSLVGAMHALDPSCFFPFSFSPGRERGRERGRMRKRQAERERARERGKRQSHICVSAERIYIYIV